MPKKKVEGTPDEEIKEETPKEDIKRTNPDFPEGKDTWAED